MELLARLVCFAEAGRLVGSARPCQDGSLYGKYLCGCHSESNDVQTLFKGSQRVEAYIERMELPYFVRLEVKGYRRSEKKPFISIRFGFCENGTEGGSSRLLQ